MESDTERVLTVLDTLGVDYKREAGARAKICCPFHAEKTPSMTIYDTNCCYCFGCQKFCWHDELIAELTRCSLIDAKKKLGTFDPEANYIYTTSPKDKFKLPNIEFADPPKDFSESFLKLPKETPKEMMDFLESKGLEKAALEIGQWRWHPKGAFKCWPDQEGICIPYFGPHGEISTFRLRRYDRMRGRFGHPLAPKNVPLQPSYMIFDKYRPVYFCEGESDSLSMRAIGRNVICLPGVGARKQLHSAIMVCFELNIPKLVFCGDNDEAGKKFNRYATNVALMLGAGRYTPQIRILRLPDEYNMLEEGAYKRKDINDFFREGRLDEIIQKCEDEDVGTQPISPRSNWDEIMETLRSVFGDEIEELPASEVDGVFD